MSVGPVILERMFDIRLHRYCHRQHDHPGRSHCGLTGGAVQRYRVLSGVNPA
jgi:hypothetical protein